MGLFEFRETLVGTTPQQHEHRRIIYSHLIKHMHHRSVQGPNGINKGFKLQNFRIKKLKNNYLIINI
jgi:hypothetical protein